MSTDKSVYGLVTPEENLISILSGYVYGGRPMQQSSLVGVLHLLKQQKEDIANLNQQLSAKTISEQNIINAFGIKGEGAHSKLVIEYVSGLVAENAALKASFKPEEISSELTDVFGDTAIIEHDSTGDNQGHSVSWSWVGNQEDVIKAVLSVVASRTKTPATDAAIDEIKAQGVDAFIKIMELKASMDSLGKTRQRMTQRIIREAITESANLRAGRKG